MNFSRRVLFTMCLSFASAVAAAEATIADPAQGISELRRVAVRSYAVAATIEDSVASVSTSNSAAELRRTLDAIDRDAHVRGFADDALFARKWQQVRRLVENVERAQSGASRSMSAVLIPSRLEADQRIQLSNSDEHGRTCASALSLRVGYELDALLTEAGQPGSELWLRLRPEGAKVLRLTTAASALDTELTLFKERCPQTDAEAVARNDDAFGLAAAVGIKAEAPNDVWFARLRNHGQAGTAAAILQVAAEIRGRITDQRTGAGVSTTILPIAPGDGWGSTFWSEADGRYVLTVDPGVYYVFADANLGGYVGELYPDTPCPIFLRIQDCINRGAQRVTVAANGSVDGIDIALNIGGRIAGTVRDRATSAPLPGASLRLFNEDGSNASPWDSVLTDAAGRYVIQGLLSGNYYLQASANPYGSQLWRHQDCAGPVLQSCAPLTGTPVAVVRDQLSAGIDFDLPRMATIHATATNPVEDLPYLSLEIFDSNGNSVSSISGGSEVFSGPLAPGTYFATGYAYGYFSQWWNDIACLPNCPSTMAQATPITVGSGGQAEIRFSFRPLLKVSGRVTDAVSHAPLRGANVVLVDVASSTHWAGSGYTDEDGRYTVTDVPPGRYYVWASSATHLDAVYPGSLCQSYDIYRCDLSAALIVTTTYPDGNAANIDFALTKGGSISGYTALRAPTGAGPLPAPYATVVVVDAQGRTVSTATVAAADGHYEAIDLLPGTYYAKVVSSEGFAQIYSGIECGTDDSCDALGGTPIPVSLSGQTTGINFNIVPTDYFFGRVIDATGRPIPGVAIDLWGGTGFDHRGVGFSGIDGYYYVQSSQGAFSNETFRASTDVGSADYDDQVYDGIACPIGSAYLGLCSIVQGTSIAAPTPTRFAIANFVLHGPRSHTVFRDGFDN